MFLGHYTHALDNKGRLTIPVRFRHAFAEGAYVIQGFEQNLMVLTPPAYEQISQRVNNMSITNPAARILKRLVFSTAGKIELDGAGRTRIPQFLMDAVGISNEIVIVGAGDFFELWSPENWKLQIAELQNTQANAERFSALNLSPGS